MKRTTVLILFILMLMMPLASCAYHGELIDRWLLTGSSEYINMDSYIEFKDDGSFRCYEGVIIIADGSYKVKGDRLIFKYTDGSVRKADFLLDGDSLTLTYFERTDAKGVTEKDDTSLEYRRVSIIS